MLPESSRPNRRIPPAGELSLCADDIADSGELNLECLIGDDDIIDGVTDLAGYSRPPKWHAGREVAAFSTGEHSQKNCVSIFRPK